VTHVTHFHYRWPQENCYVTYTRGASIENASPCVTCVTAPERVTNDFNDLEEKGRPMTGTFTKPADAT
jgi:hypothetical protein